MNQLIPVFMTELEALRFVDFSKHYDLIEKLGRAGAFDMKNGNITLHFNSEGNVRTVEVKHLYNFI